MLNMAEESSGGGGGGGGYGGGRAGARGSMAPSLSIRRRRRSMGRRNTIVLCRPFDDGQPPPSFTAGSSAHRRLTADQVIADPGSGGPDGVADPSEDLPFPAFVGKAFFFFEQTTRPRSWCLKAITWPYPLEKFLLFLSRHRIIYPSS